MANNRRDLTGNRFGRLVALEVAPRGKSDSMWWCTCDCGGKKAVNTQNLLRGVTRSCGCLQREESSRRAIRLFTKPKQLCKADGCPNDTSKGGHGLCGKHAQRFRRYGDVEYVTSEDRRRELSRIAQLENVVTVKPTTYRKSFGKHEHRRVMETYIGRSLRSDEIVHHIDGDRHNNAIDNLKVMTRAEHGRLHNTKHA